MTPRQANALTVVGLGGLLAAVSLSAPRWADLLRQPLATYEEEEAAREGLATSTAPTESQGPQVARRISVRLYFEASDRDGLLPEERTIAFSADLARQLRTVVEELVKGPTTGLIPTLPAQTRVLEVFVTARGVAYVDLSTEAGAGLPGGSRSELLTVYSVVDTLVTNFPAVSRVQILLDDRQVPSLAGHVDVSRPLPPDMTLVALPTPSAPPSREGSP
jgi:spore germination protein GerM